MAGVVLNQQLQPHESHIPFVLQFMIDHHLFGMNHIHLANVKFRISTDSRKWHCARKFLHRCMLHVVGHAAQMYATIVAHECSNCK